METWDQRKNLDYPDYNSAKVNQYTSKSRSKQTCQQPNERRFNRVQHSFDKVRKIC